MAEGTYYIRLYWTSGRNGVGGELKVRDNELVTGCLGKSIDDVIEKINGELFGVEDIKIPVMSRASESLGHERVDSTQLYYVAGKLKGKHPSIEFEVYDN